MKKNTIILFDVDGTLVDSKTHIIPDSTKLALHKLHERGYPIGISTGRSLDSLEHGGFCDLIDWDIYLCNNGQAIYDHEKAIVHMECIPEEIVKECIKISESINNPLLLQGTTPYITAPPNENVIQAQEFFKEIIPPVHPYDGKEVIMMIAYGPEGYDYHDYMRISGIDVICGLSTYADIVLHGYNKYIGVQKVLNHLQIDTYYAFGDSLNDVEMIEHATVGIAMGNAHEDLKKIANITTECVLEDGIYRELLRQKLID